MKRVVITALFLALGAAPRADIKTDRIWFSPGPGTLDYIRLFEHPDEWRHARDLVDVFKFYQGHAQPANQVFAPNTYAALVNANAFHAIKMWGKRPAIEVGVVKDFYCTPDASGMNRAIEDTLVSVRAVGAAGGTVDYLAMDDPFASGRASVCGGPALEPTADRIATWVRGVGGSVPPERIGLIEAYPFSSEAAIESMLDLLRSRGVPPAFLHMDVDLNAIRPPASDFTRDIRQLKDVCRAQNVPFGIIFWGNNADADVLYTLDATRLVDATAVAFPTWEDMPDHLIVQSWAQTRTGLWITPNNLGEDRPYAHTNFLWQTYRRLRGQTGPASGTAIPK